MGNWVTVEAFRQIKVSGDLRNVSKFGHVFLVAPDIDLDFFKSEMRRIGTPSKPFYVVLSQDDKALWASKLIGGGQTRLGDDPNVIELAKLGATVIDLTDVKADDATGHGKFAQLAEVAPELGTVLGLGVGSRPGIARDEAIQRSINGVTSISGVVTLPVTLLGARVNIVSGQ